MALRTRDISGVGQFVDVSMLDSMISAMTTNFMIYLGSGDVPGPLGTAYTSIVPYRAFATKDTAIAIAVGSEKLWRAFGPAIGRPELVDHGDYATNDLRVKNRDRLEPLLAELFCRDTMENWLTKFRAAGIPSSPIRRLDEVVNDAQCAVREMFPSISHPSSGPVTVIGSPIRYSAERPLALSDAPKLGQHTKRTLSEWLGLQAIELSDLQSRGAIFQADEG